MKALKAETVKPRWIGVFRAVQQWTVDEAEEVEELDSRLKRMTILSLLSFGLRPWLPSGVRILFGLMSTAL